ncbi:ergothioneine biosynthesis protein EgtB [Nocardiopsis gilva YIM 90087]|uniref:Hercynine oxygenase n=1 Tax=Nocardiopsis gilva YIM 90087 TaxID=1235441 RepID=A0A223SA23_9ACTN|nr:ergothioneine biosynthesis protein EgtB [Nocardiopsis gilva]ASU84939.1 ergothioneine biosynthesis protein EgtB [Nocardiopsis gilva YIM 90087]
MTENPDPTQSADPSTSTPSTLRERIAAELDSGRRRSEGLTVGVLDDADLIAQHSPLMSPLVWDFAHVGNYEEQWLVRAAAGRDALRPDIDVLYDAFENPRAERVTLPLLRPREAEEYNAQVRRMVLDSLEHVSFDSGTALLDSGFVYHMVIQHEHQHDETMLATHQLRRGDPVLDVGAVPPPALPSGPSEVLVAGGPFTMGTDDDPWAYDNERGAHTVDLPAFWIDTRAVTNAAHMDFIADGGYDDSRWWSEEGWAWRSRTGKHAPAFWRRDAGQWLRRRFGRVEPVPPDEPVQHVSFYEAEAHARWAGKRLPTEAEWEKAARHDPATGTSLRFPWGADEPGHHHANLGQRLLHPTPAGTHPGGTAPSGAQQMLGDVWEWTASDFTAYPGFQAFPYPEYSEVFFGGDYKVLRGGSWATHPTAIRGTFRNWDHPIRRQIFSGFRCARNAEVE